MHHSPVKSVGLGSFKDSLGCSLTIVGPNLSTSVGTKGQLPNGSRETASWAICPDTPRAQPKYDPKA